ncbi:MAG TPA: hypothetical protein VFL66_03165 [Gaiellaceae bacterium]|nr:hypothetical protein [Gaiellaceae bacterium]
MGELRMRAPVLATLPGELLAVEVEAGGHQVGASLVKEPVRLRLTSTTARGGIEAIEHALPIEEQQPVLRSTPRGEEQQRQLVGEQHLLVVEAECDLPVALGQMACQLEDVLGADAPSTRLRGGRIAVTVGPYLSEFRPGPDHAASRPFRRFRGSGMTLPITPSEAPSITPPKPTPRCFPSAASSSSSANSDAASSCCADSNGTRRGGSSRISSLEFFFANHRRASRGAKIKTMCEKARASRRTFHYREALSDAEK